MILKINLASQGLSIKFHYMWWCFTFYSSNQLFVTTFDTCYAAIICIFYIFLVWNATKMEDKRHLTNNILPEPMLTQISVIVWSQ